eukprot:TRINITY_DN2259_c0_g1_i3.p1 TRINITY_DN2259_c0_g1~~TRINITY_DN2259_c0_g1_i3.p1  ORF type:complete len:667 (+),score=92.70 TRINITY_DN2259_c0_g1_i3:137-2137(+)
MPRRRKTPKEGEGFETEQSSAGRGSQDVRVSSGDVRYVPQVPQAPPQQGRGGGAYAPPGRGGRGSGPSVRGRGPPPPQGFHPPSYPPQHPGGRGPALTEPHSQYGGRGAWGARGRGGRGVPPQSFGERSFPELHQAELETSRTSLPAFLTPRETTPTEELPRPAPTEELPRPPQSTVVEVVEQVQQLSLQPSGSEAAPASSKALRFPRRPGMGMHGRRCSVKANHFVAWLLRRDLHQYDVTITPEVTSRAVNRAVMGELVELYKESHLGKRLPVYDGRKSLYTAGPMPFASKDFTITLTEENDGVHGARREREFKVTIKCASRPDLYHLDQFLAGRQADAPQEALQVLDVVLRELPTHRYFPIGRSFYSPELGTRQPLGEGLESWRGFYQSIRPTQMGLSLNIDMSSTAFIEPLPVIDFVMQLLNTQTLSRPLSDAERVKIKKALRGIKVEVTHRANIRRKYRISGLTSQPTRELTFAVDDNGTTKSVVQYFQETYAFTIQFTNLPCLQVGNQQRTNYLPMEVCKIVQGQRYSRRLNEKQITRLLKATCQRPREREMDILQTVRKNNYNRDQYAKEFGISISNELAEVEARVLPPPVLKYHDDGPNSTCLPEIGQWNMKNKKMVNGGTVNHWACINFSRYVHDNAAKSFCFDLAQMCNVSGMVQKS